MTSLVSMERPRISQFTQCQPDFPAPCPGNQGRVVAPADAFALIPAMDGEQVNASVIGHGLTARPPVQDQYDGVLLCHAPQIMTDLVIGQWGQIGD